MFGGVLDVPSQMYVRGRFGCTLANVCPGAFWVYIFCGAIVAPNMFARCIDIRGGCKMRIVLVHEKNPVPPKAWGSGGEAPGLLTLILIFISIFIVDIQLDF
jgi:hypothetical protein